MKRAAFTILSLILLSAGAVAECLEEVTVTLPDGTYSAAGDLMPPLTGPVLWTLEVDGDWLRFKMQGSVEWSDWLLLNWITGVYEGFSGGVWHQWVFSSDGDYIHAPVGGSHDTGIYELL